jgi:hypothetical protein
MESQAIPTNDTTNVAHINTSQFMYSHDEVEQLLTTAQLKGYNKEFEEGREVGIIEFEMLRKAEMANCIDSSNQTTATSTIDTNTQTSPITAVDTTMQTA